MDRRPTLVILAIAAAMVALLLAIGDLRGTKLAPAPAPSPGPLDAASRDAGSDAFVPTRVESPPRTPYPLDDFPRSAELAREGCPDVPLVDHVGEPIAWRPLFRVHPVFVPSVRALEAAIAETAREIYGRSPVRLLSASGYRCTTVRGRPERISEHALGNAIDLRGIELDDGEPITVRDHWHTAEGADPVHARFFRTLVVRVIERGLFRGIIGPPDPDHMDHLHFDQGPSSFVDVSLE
jgi:hypothetical protein